MAIVHIVLAKAAVLENQAWTIMLPASGLRLIVLHIQSNNKYTFNTACIHRNQNNY